MSRDPKYDILFEPIAIGPKTLRNRFWQVPHCNGAGSEHPGVQALFRGMKAEGGWGAVFTEMCTISPDADVMPLVSAKLWDADDVRSLGAMCDAIHEHDSLAGVELLHTGGHANNFETRGPARGVSQIPSDFIPMANTRAMTKREIRQMRREHVEGALRAREAGFDLLTLFCSLGSVPIQFFYPVNNKRTDEYGGSFENRIRFTREVLEDMRSEIDDCAIGIRWSIDTLERPYGYGDGGVRAHAEGKDFIAALDDLVDYWDINIGNLNWGEDAGPSRFFDTNHQAPYTRYAKEVTSKPTINVGRFTDPDVMVQAITSGQCDIIGAARPSIADPFLPKKIEEGRLDDIRECIGCNICVSKWEQGGPPITCTQNATSGEEYRRGWHPERFSKAANADNNVLVVGAGPAGMECAMVLAKRGLRTVHLVDEQEDLGGHLRWVTQLPGLRQWGRVTNYRRIQLDKQKSVTTILNTRLSTEQILEYGADYVVLATGSHWTASGINGTTREVIPIDEDAREAVLTPEDIMVRGRTVSGSAVVYDTDGYYMGVSIAEQLARAGTDVTYVAPSDTIAPYLRYTLEEQRQYARLVELGVTVVPQTLVEHYARGNVRTTHVWTGAEQTIAADALVLCCARISSCETYDELSEQPERLQEAGVKGLFLIGDAHTPSTIAESVFSGHRLAREFDQPDPAVALPFIRERPADFLGADGQISEPVDHDHRVERLHPRVTRA
jgi:dimethylamine/trimethylamine dehydrogenase